MDSRQSLIRPPEVCARLCLVASRCARRAPLDTTDNDFEIDEELGIITFNIFHVCD